MLVVSGLVLAVSWRNPAHRAVIGMAWGLIVLWIGCCGLAMWRWREGLCRLAARVRLPWQVKFVLGCTTLALTEEAITTLMTNCAPLFGVTLGEAYITASANYFDVRTAAQSHERVVSIPKQPRDTFPERDATTLRVTSIRKSNEALKLSLSLGVVLQLSRVAIEVAREFLCFPKFTQHFGGCGSVFSAHKANEGFVFRIRNEDDEAYWPAGQQVSGNFQWLRLRDYP
jgi:hypothetical protein